MDDRLEKAKARLIESVANDYGFHIKKAGGKEVKLVCPHPDHKDTDASCYINTETNLFKCHGCGWAGSTIDFVMGVEGVHTKRAIDILVGESQSEGAKKKPQKSMTKKKYKKGPEYKTGQWDYKDESGNKIYSSIRYDYPDGSKDFDLMHWEGDSLQWGLPSEARRVPLHLDQFKGHQEIWLSEGEKCSDSLNSLGIFSTNIAGGSKGTRTDIEQTFKGKDVVLLPDNDKGGREFMKGFAADLWGIAKSTRVLDVGTPRNPKGYDIHDKVVDLKLEGMDNHEVHERLMIMKDASLYLLEGEAVPILNEKQREAEYKLMLTLDGFDMGDYIPDLKGIVRPLIPGDCVGIVGGTGSGKTSMLTFIAECASPLIVLNFNIELSTGVFYEREVSAASDVPASQIEARYRNNEPVEVGNKLSHVYTVALSRVTPDEIRKQFWNFVKLTGLYPDFTCVDYVQLLKGKGVRYERTTDNAEEIRILAKELYTRMIFTSQKSRAATSKKDGKDPTPSLHDAKDSGGLENSMSVYMDIRPHPDHEDVKLGVILKNTRGPAGVEFEIGWNGACTKFLQGPLEKPDAISPPVDFDGPVPNHATPDEYEDDESVPF